MKKAYSIVLLLPFVIACSHNSKIENHKIVDSLVEYRDTIVGNFSGLGIDTLIAEPIDTLTVPEFEGDEFGNQHYKWRVFSKSRRLKELIVNDTNDMKFVTEGDLDGNGTDEWGFRTQWSVSNWHTYQIYTYHNGEWYYIAKPIMVNTPDFEKLRNGFDIAEPNTVKGQIDIKFSRPQKGNDCIVDTVVKATYITISDNGDCIS